MGNVWGMEFLAQALDDPDPQPCGKCASCLETPVVKPTVTRATTISAARFLHHSEMALESKKQVASDAFVVRREKPPIFSGCETHPATVAPAGSNRSGDGGNEITEASGVEGRERRLGKHAGRNVSKR